MHSCPEQMWPCWITGTNARYRRRRQLDACVVDGADKEYADYLLQDLLFTSLEHVADAVGVTTGEQEASESILGGVVLQMVGPCSGVLQRSRQIRYLGHYYGGDWSKLVLLQVVASFQFLRPIRFIHEGYGMEAPKHLFFRLTNECKERALANHVAGVVAEATARDVVHHWQMSLGLGINQPEDWLTVLQLPHPVCVLSVGGLWHDLALHSALRCDKRSPVSTAWKAMRLHIRNVVLADVPVNRDVPLAAHGPQAIANANDNVPQPQHHLFDRKMFEHAIDALQRWSPTLLAHASQPDAALLSDVVHWLQDCVGALVPEAFGKHSWRSQQGRGAHWNELLQQRGGYNPPFLLQVLIFSFMTRGSGIAVHGQTSNPNAAIFKQAIRTFPVTVQGMLHAMLEKQLYPSPATLSRARLYLDVAFMLAWQDKHRALAASGAIAFSMLDASPQGQGWSAAVRVKRGVSDS